MKGRISINRMSTNNGHVCNLEIRDGISGTKVLEAQLSFEALGNAITGLSYQDITYELGIHLGHFVRGIERADRAGDALGVSDGAQAKG